MKSTSEDRQHILWVDLIRIIGVLLVIMIHVSTAVVYAWNKKPIQRGDVAEWLVGVSYDMVARPSVPLFIMASGFLLLRKIEPVLDFLRKRFLRVVIPFLAWASFYFFWDPGFQKSEKWSRNIYLLAKSIAVSNVEYHLWFIYAILGLYLVTPVIRLFTHSAQMQDYAYFFVVCIISGPLAYLIIQWLGFEISIPGSTYFAGYIGYFVAGYVLGQSPVSRKIFWIALSTFVVVAGLSIGGTYYFSAVYKHFYEYFFDYLSLPVIFTSLCFFVIIKYLSDRPVQNSLVERLVRDLGRASFGIYLTHILFLKLLDQGFFGTIIQATPSTALFSIPLVTGLCYILSYLLVWILARIPGIKVLVGY